MVENGLLEIRDSPSNKLIWSGTFDGGHVLFALPLAGTEDCVVIIEGEIRNVDSNVMRISPVGDLIWRIAPAPEFGAYAKIALTNGQLVAWSWSGYRLEIDAEHGAITDKTFVK